jgi:tetratricopeptide (TPR) repeat protein
MKKLIPVLLIIIVCFISYFNIFDNEFVWDDHVFILDNSDIRSFANVPLFFTSDFEGLYRPLRSVHYTLVYAIAGKNEFFYHFNSLFFHSLISILVYFIILEIVKRKNVSLLAALIFAAHPIHTGRVTNITAGFDLLGVFLMLFSFYLYVKFSKNKKYFFGSLVLFVLALLASEEAIVLPLIIVLYEFVFNKGKFNLKNIFTKKIFNYGFFWFFIIAVLFVALRFLVLGISGRQEQYLAGNLFLTFLTMLKVYVYYIYLLIFPVNLSLYHDVIPATGIDLKIIFSFLFLLILFIVVIKYHKNKILFFSVFWFFITLLPFSNFIPIQNFIAERYLYLPSVGFALLVSYGLILLYNLKIKNIRYSNLLKKIIIVIAVLIFAFYIIKTVDRNDDWQDNLTLWSETVETSPWNSRAHDNLGFTYDQLGETEKALMEFEKSVELMPDNYRALTNLGVAYAKVGKYNDSLDVLRKSIEIKEYHKTYDKLGLVYVELKDDDKAIEAFEKAIQINKRYAKAHNDLATVYGRQGKFDLALGEFKEAIRIDRDYADAHYNLGILLEFLDEKELAKKEFNEALRLEPGNELYKRKLKK